MPQNDAKSCMEKQYPTVKRGKPRYWIGMEE